MTGAGMATFGGFAVMAAAQLILLNRKFGRVTAGRAFYIKLIKAVLPMAIFLYVIEQLFQLSGWESRIGATIEVGLFCSRWSRVFLYLRVTDRGLDRCEWAMLPFGEKLYRIQQRGGLYDTSNHGRRLRSRRTGTITVRHLQLTKETTQPVYLRLRIILSFQN